MDDATLVLVIAAVAIAFWAGSRWRHNKRTWSDYQVAKSATKTLQKKRWVTFKAALLAIAATMVYLFATGAITLGAADGRGGATPANMKHPSPSPSHSPERSATSRK
jgi:hypothetical protein